MVFEVRITRRLMNWNKLYTDTLCPFNTTIYAHVSELLDPCFAPLRFVVVQKIYEYPFTEQERALTELLSAASRRAQRFGRTQLSHVPNGFSQILFFP